MDVIVDVYCFVGVELMGKVFDGIVCVYYFDCFVKGVIVVF